jgi:hypothetical protein
MSEKQALRRLAGMPPPSNKRKPWRVFGPRPAPGVHLVVANDDAVDVLEALRRAYTDTDGREDQSRQHWKALRGWLELSAAKCDSAADQGDGNEDLEDVVADYRTEARTLRSALHRMTELEAGQ